MNKATKWTDKTPAAAKGSYISDSAHVELDDEGVIQFIRSDSHISTTSTSEIIKNYIDDEIERFCNFNHISKNGWKKRGVIEKTTNNLGLTIYVLYYKTLFRACKHEIKFSPTALIK